MHFACLDRARERFLVRVRNHQHLSAGGVLRDNHHCSRVFVEANIVQVDWYVHESALPGSPEVGVTRISRTAAANFAFVAIASPPNAVVRPFQSVNEPPASVMTGSSAAPSHTEITSSTITSARPVATSR